MQPRSKSAPDPIQTVSINQGKLTIQDIVDVARHFAGVEPFRGPRRKKTEKVRRFVEEHWFSDSAPPRYGFNTGIGSLKSVRIARNKIEKFQELYIKSHCVGVGRPLDTEIVRAAMLLQANALSRGYSGIRPIIVDKLIEMLNKRIHPVVPEHGSLGASGDLAPLTHIASVLVGEDEAELWQGEQRMRLKDIKDSSQDLHLELGGETVEFQPIRLQGKEAISLTNATTFMLALGVLLTHDAEILLKSADIAAALSLEAMMCKKDAFCEPLHDLRNQTGQINTAANLRNLTDGSHRMTPEARQAYFETSTARQLKTTLSGQEDQETIQLITRYKVEHEFEKHRVQDAYSLRCVPQVHGACKDAFNFVKTIVTREMEAVTDNPVIFETDEGFESKSGGNFHGEPLALAMDFLTIALAEIGSISERRTFRLLSPRMSFGLPNNLTDGEVGLNSGFMMLQYTAAQIASENKILSHPASVDTIPTSDNQEDHVSMGFTAARKARSVLHNVENILAIELLCGVQGVHLSSKDPAVSLAKFALGKGTAVAFNVIRSFEDSNKEKPFQVQHDDEYLHRRIVLMTRLCSTGRIVEQVEERSSLKI
ncbi:MAG: histidine ammonia-lyase [bacterium]